MSRMMSFYAKDFALSLEIASDLSLLGIFVVRLDDLRQYDFRGLYNQQGDEITIGFYIDWHHTDNVALFSSFTGNIDCGSSILTLELEWILIDSGIDYPSGYSSSDRPVILTSDFRSKHLYEGNPYPYAQIARRELTPKQR